MASSPKKSLTPNKEEILAAVKQVLEDGEARIADQDEHGIRAIRTTKIGQKNNKDGIIKELNDELQNRGFVVEGTKRIYRRADDMDDPNAGSQAAVNRLTKPLGTRVSRGHVEAFNAVSSKFKSKREALEHAIQLLAEETGVELDLDLD